MWNRNRVWIQYLRNITAADRNSAVFLSSYLRRIGISKDYVRALEIYDLQKYKVIKDAGKIKNSLKERKNKPFVFVGCKN